MKQFMIQRVLPVVLSFSLMLPIVSVQTFAAYDFPEMYRDRGSVTDWEAEIVSPGATLLNSLSVGLGSGPTANEVFWSMVNQVISEYGEVSYNDLQNTCSHYATQFTYELGYSVFDCFKDSEAAIAGNTLVALFGLKRPDFVILEDPVLGILRIKDRANNLWVVNRSGRYPYVDTNSTDGESGGDYWETANNVYKNVIRGEGPGGRFTSKGSLESMKDYLVQEGTNCWITEIGGSGMMGITKSGYFFCDEAGRPYFCWETDYQAAVNQDRPTSSIVNGNGEELEVPKDMEVGIDVENQFVLLPSSDIAYTGSIIYDVVNKTYNVETHKVNNYTEENYEVITNNYTYEYFIQNTTVTYIGETMDYEKYECYYTLPDGRSSADLTKEELEQLNVGIDLVEYDRTTDDVRLRALYHFDGDTKDSSYWNYLSDFKWSNVPSITYMDVETFGGALYFDPNVTSTFRVALPSEIGSGDFTIQFRYYQGQATAEDDRSGLYMNTTYARDEWSPTKDATAIDILHFDGDSIYTFLDEDGAPDCVPNAYPVGSWVEVAITRSNELLTYYVNGQPLIVDDTYGKQSFDNGLTFHFSDNMSAYKMVDELRVLNYAIASGKGSYYEPTAVPHDTNLALVLPEDKVVVADEYWTFESSKENMLVPYGLDNFTNFDPAESSNFHAVSSTFTYNATGGTWSASPALSYTPFHLYYNTYFNSLNDGTGLSLTAKDTAYNGSFVGTQRVIYIDSEAIYTTGFQIPVSWGSNMPLSGTYTFSAVLSDGTVFSIPFTVSNGMMTDHFRGWLSSYYVSLGGRFIALTYHPDARITAPIIYMEIVEGSGTDLTATYHSNVTVIEKEEFFKPLLAVRTDLEITDHQIGGVRPSIPQKGLVYAMVESGYITSLQIYNGQAWEACDGRIWTGERWIPYSSYNVITLQDMYDIVDATPDYEYIYTESGFWAWWQKSWNAFTNQLFGLLGTGSGTSGGNGDLTEDIPEANPDEEGGATLLEFIVLVFNGGKAVISGFRDLFSGAVSSVPDAVNTLTSAFKPGGIAVSIFENRDPDLDVVAVMDLDRLGYYQTEEVLDPWRYR